MEIINHEYYVDLEIAKLLEKAGFNWVCKDKFYDFTNHCEIYKKPTLDVAQQWLREVKGYIILVNYNEFLKTFYYSICYTKNTNRYIDDRDDCRNTPFEEAQKAGIKKALKLLLEKGE